MIKPLGISIITPDSEEGKEIFSKDAGISFSNMLDTGEEGDDEDTLEKFKSATFEKTVGSTEDLGKDNLLYGFAKTLFDDGLIDLDEEEDLKDFSTKEFKDKIAAAIEKQSSQKHERFVNKFSGAKKMFLEMGDYFDSETEAISIAKDMDMLENITDSEIDDNESLAESIIIKALSVKNLSQKEIQKTIEDLKDLDKLSERAKDYVPELKTTLKRFVENAKQQKQKAKRDAAEKEESYYKDLINTIEESDEIVPGMKLTERTKSILKDKMLKPVFTDENGNQYNELGFKQKQHPKEFNIAIEMLNTLGLFEFDKKGAYKPDLSKLSKLVESNVKTSVDRLVSDEQKISRSNASSDAVIDELRKAMGK